VQKEYIALVVFQFLSSSNDLYEEVFIQIKANSDKDAKKIAENYANNSEHEYKNNDGNTVRKKSIQVIDVVEVLYQEAENNVRELYSRHFDDFDSYKKIETFIK
jgi:hypothetical protein